VSSYWTAQNFRGRLKNVSGIGRNKKESWPYSCMSLMLTQEERKAQYLHQFRTTDRIREAISALSSTVNFSAVLS